MGSGLGKMEPVVVWGGPQNSRNSDRTGFRILRVGNFTNSKQSGFGEELIYIYIPVPDLLKPSVK